MKYQIRQNGFGLTLVEADSPMKALLKYVEQKGGDSADIQKMSGNEILWHGLVYHTEPSI